MLKKIIYIKNLIFLLFLSSCYSVGLIVESRIEEHQYSNWSDLKTMTDDIINDDKAIIIGTIHNKIVLSNPKSQSRLKLQEEWNKYGTTWIVSDRSNYYSGLIYLKESFSTEGFYKVKAGEYFLVNIGKLATVDIVTTWFLFNKNHNVIFGFPAKKMNWGKTLISLKHISSNLDKYPLAGFIAKPKEVIYIGDINFITQINGLFDRIVLIEIDDNYDDAVKLFRKKYPSLKNVKVVKNIIKPGYLFHDNMLEVN
jgi:hypothetical protein